MKKFLPIAIILISVYLISSYSYPYEYQRYSFPDPQYPIRQVVKEKPNQEWVKLVIMGDSLMAGVGSSSNIKSLSYLVAKSLAGSIQSPNLELINLATPGSGVEDVLQNQLPEATAEKPDFVVIMVGVNDVHNLKSGDFFKAKYGRIVEALNSGTTAKVSLINIPYLGSDRIIYPPWNFLLDLRTAQFNDIIRKLSQKNVGLVDLYGNFKQQFEQTSDLYSMDEFHPSDQGYVQWAGYINANLNR